MVPRCGRTSPRCGRRLAAPERHAALGRSAAPLLEATGVSFSYGRAPVLEHVDLRVVPGEFVALVGPNGSGKSTLLKLLLGSLTPSEGEVRLFGAPPRRRQGPLAARLRAATSRPGLGGPRDRRGDRRHRPARAPRMVASAAQGRPGRGAHALESVGLAEFAERPVNELSGGQQQRAFIARAFASEPELLVLDEPIAGVDAESQRRFRDSLVHLMRDHGAGVLLVSHELSAVANDLDRVVVLKGTVLFDGPPSRAHRRGRQPGHAPRGPPALARGAALMPWPISALPYPFELEFMQRALVAGHRRRRLRADDRDVPGAEADVADRRRDRPRRVRGRRRRPDRRHLAGLDGARVRGRRRARDRVAAVASPGLRRPRARAVLLLGDRARRRVREPGRRPEREPADVPVRPAADGERQRARRDPDPGRRDRRRDAGAAPRAVRGRDRRGLVAGLGSAGRVRQQRARGADRGRRRRRDADRRHPVDRRDDGAARSRAASSSRGRSAPRSGGRSPSAWAR